MTHICGATHACINCRLEVPLGEACPVVRAMDGRGGVWLPAQQIHAILEPLMSAPCGLSAFERLFHTKASKKVLTGPDRAQLVSLGAAQPRSSAISMVKLHAVLKALKGRLTPHGKPILTGLQRLQDLRLVIPWGAASAQQWQVAEPLPSSLPSSTAISRQRYCAVSLSRVAPHLLEANPLAEQLNDFEQWLTSRIQLDRDGHAIARSTWTNVSAHLLHFLGFLHVHCNMALPNLVDFLKPDLHAIFLRHTIEKGTKFHMSRHHVYVSKKVINFLRAQPRGGHDSLPRLLIWLQRAAAQIKDSAPIPRKSVQAMEAAGTWVSAAVLLEAIMRGKVLAEDAASHPPVTWTAARTLHDAALSCCIFGYLPPPRLSCLRNCTIPSFDGECRHPDCKDRANCHGNQLVHDALADGSMAFHFPHHKTSIGRQYARPITFRLPSELAALLQLYLQHGRPRLMGRGDPHPYMFLAKSGHHLDSKVGASKLNGIFTAWLSRLGCKQISPSTCRHIFVVDRRSNALVPGPADQDAAIVMGHSTAQWDHGIYDVSKFELAAQNAVDGMAAWRAAHHQQAVAVQHGSNAQPTQPADQARVQRRRQPFVLEDSESSDDDSLYVSIPEATEGESDGESDISIGS